jgi:hypothetical protein
MCLAASANLSVTDLSPLAALLLPFSHSPFHALSFFLSGGFLLFFVLVISHSVDHVLFFFALHLRSLWRVFHLVVWAGWHVVVERPRPCV